MLTIRLDQREALRENLFRRQLKEHLMLSLAPALVPPSEATFQTRLDHALRIARAHGFAAPDSALASFAALLFLAGPGFPDHPAVRAVLDDAILPAQERIARLAALPAWTWAAASDPSDAAWNAGPDGAA